MVEIKRIKLKNYFAIVLSQIQKFDSHSQVFLIVVSFQAASASCLNFKVHSCRRCEWHLNDFELLAMLPRNQNGCRASGCHFLFSRKVVSRFIGNTVSN